MSLYKNVLFFARYEGNTSYFLLHDKDRRLAVPFSAVGVRIQQLMRRRKVLSASSGCRRIAGEF